MTIVKPPDKAFILAAGMGSRLRPYTDSMPKPMVSIAGKSIIHRALEKLSQEGVQSAIVNTHYLAPVLEDHLASISKPEILLSREDKLLDTGGGIKKEIGFFKDAFFILNGDALWEDREQTALSRLSAVWDETAMDILLLLQPVGTMSLTGGVGDYDLTAEGKAVRSKVRTGEYMFAGIRIAHPKIFNNAPDGAFSFLKLMDEAEAKGRLYGIAHDGAWHHISTPKDYVAVDAHFRERGL